jgi:hypothetical protein
MRTLLFHSSFHPPDCLCLKKLIAKIVSLPFQNFPYTLYYFPIETGLKTTTKTN